MQGAQSKSDDLGCYLGSASRSECSLCVSSVGENTCQIFLRNRFDRNMCNEMRSDGGSSASLNKKPNNMVITFSLTSSIAQLLLKSYIIASLCPDKSSHSQVKT